MENINMTFWGWWIVALFLLGVELLMPGFFFLWIAIAGFVTGCMLLFIPIASLNIQLMAFAVLSVISIMLWRLYAPKHPLHSDRPLLNKRGQQYVGRVFNLIEPIQNGQGKIKVDDTLWKVYGEDCGLNSKVKVIAIKGTVFEVKKVD